MKKILSILMIFAILLVSCACTANNSSHAETPTIPAISDPNNATPEELYGHIDQTVPIDGFYKLWNPDGIKFMLEHPDGKFEILCSIDMQGAVLSPIAEFTGTIMGTSFTISNFTVQGGSEENFGFICVNKGMVQDIFFDNVTLLPGANAKNIGSLAGVNEGKLNRSNITGTMTVEKAADNAACGGIVGVNTGTLTNVIATVETTYAAPGAAKVGSFVGCATGGTIEFLEQHGKLTVTGSNKVCGLFAGDASDVVFKDCVFSGSDNSIDGKLFVNFTGNEDDDELAVAHNAKWRDNAYYEPLPDKVMAVRQKVVDTMYKLCTVEWRVKENVVHSCTCNLTNCHGIFNADYVYYGIPYNHKSSPLSRVEYCLDENGYVQDWFYDLGAFDGFDMYFGGDCSSTVESSWWTVSNSVDFQSTLFMPEAYGRGTIAVGDYVCDFIMTGKQLTEEYILANDEMTMYESYAQMRPGDAVINRVEDGGHTRMVASYPVIVKDQQGNIDPDYSYVLTHEQGSPVEDHKLKISSSCKVNWKRTFSNLYFNWYIPVTCEEFLTGEMETPEATLENGCNGYAGMFTGTVRANYHLASVTLKVVDANGETLVEHPFFTTSQKNEDYNNHYFTARNYMDHLNLADMANVLSRVRFQQGETYHYTLTANLATFDDIPVHEGSFTYGAA